MALIRAALVNDYEVVVKGLAAMLRAYRDTVDVVELDVRTNVDEHVDIALYDTFAATQGDREEVKALAVNPRVGKVVVYSWDMDEHLVTAALANGARGLRLQRPVGPELVTALVAVHRGESASIRCRTAHGTVVVGDWPGREEGLTQREAEMLALITQGLSNTQIAERTRLRSTRSSRTSARATAASASRTARMRSSWGVEHGFRPDRNSTR